MRTLILGAGALGGYFGARLLAAGREVTFLVRPARAALLAANGLHVVSPHGGDLRLPPPPTILTPERPYDLVLLSAKSYDLQSAIEAIAPAVGPDTLVLPMLNGMAHMAVLDERFGATRVLGGTCFISSTLDAEGTIHHLNGRDGLFFGQRAEVGAAPHPNLQAIADTLLDANFQAAQRTDITQDMWNKWTFLAALAGITCLLRANIGEIAEAGATPLALTLSAECVAVAEAEGHRPPEEFTTQNRAYLTGAGSTLHASMLRDLEANAPIEAQQIIGDLYDRARRHGIATPVLGMAHAHLRSYEARRAARG